jgi:4-hydroxybenzoate polyprenyltransferase
MKTLWYIIVSMRPKQWTKNLVLFAGILFSKRFLELSLIKYSLMGFGVFCLLSGAIYILNDVFDRRGDMEHPVKRKRPIPAGLLGIGAASVISTVIIAVLVPVSLLLGMEFFLLTVVFVILNLMYSLYLRRIVILDVMTISFNFLVRAAAGVVALRTVIPGLEFSPWLWICTLFLSLFLAICKRRNEMCVLEENASNHRDSLKEYSVHLLDQLVGLAATATIVSYSIYTVWPATVEKFGTNRLVYTIPFVVFGIMRYLYLVYNRQVGGDPSGVLLTERSIMIDVFLWFVATLLILMMS